MNSKDIQEYTLPGSIKNGILIHPFLKEGGISHDVTKPHRDNHYQLLFAFEGQYHFRIDFEEIELQAPFILQIEPGQVHQIIKSENPKGWAFGIEPSFLEEELKTFLDNRNHQIINLEKNEFSLQESADKILERAFFLQSNTINFYTSRAVFHLVSSVLYLLINEKDISKKGNSAKEKRAYVIEQEFRALLKNKYREWKSPFQYAEKLFMTTAHLNDAIKEVTGKSVTAHLQEQNILEAKRLLYFTDLEVKQIAFDIGFEDPVYFGRLFRKLTGYTPLGFRNKFRD